MFGEHVEESSGMQDVFKYVEIEWVLPEHVNMDTGESTGTLAIARLAKGGLNFREVLFDFDQPRYGEILLSIDNKNWTRHLYVDYDLLSYGDVSIFYKLEQQTDLLEGDGFPELFIDVKER